MCDAKAFLQGSLSELLLWENWFYAEKKDPRYKSDKEFIESTKALARSRLDEILTKMLTKEAYKEYAQANLSTLGVGRPRIYAQAIIEAIAPSSDRVAVITANSEMPVMYLKYFMMPVSNEGWQVTDIYSSFDKVKWTKKHSV